MNRIIARLTKSPAFLLSFFFGISLLFQGSSLSEAFFSFAVAFVLTSLAFRFMRNKLRGLMRFPGRRR